MDQLPLVDEVCPHAFDDLTFKVPRHTDKVCNQECAYCCNTTLHPGGIFVCSKCFVGCCAQHLEKHMQLENTHTTYIRIESSIPYPENEPEITDATQVGANPPQKENKITCYCGDCGICYKLEADFEIAASASVKAIVNADAPTNDAQQDSAASWGLEKPCEHCNASLPQLPCQRFGTGEGKTAPNESSKCTNCDCSKNCWLCLTCGNVGCPRKEAGGNEHGVFHFMMTGHPLVVKLGTVTPVRADIHCYKCDNEMSNYAEFAKHLSHFGIQQQSAIKTAKSLAEMEVDRSLKHEYDSVQEAGVKLVPVYGRGLTGLTNFGNSCYIASIIQALYVTAPFSSAFVNRGHIAGCKRSQPLNCFECQAERLFAGIASGHFAIAPSAAQEENYRSQRTREDRNGIVPRLWKQLIAGSNPDWKGKEQQDAEEYFNWIMSQVSEIKSFSPDLQNGQKHPGKIFEYLEETRRSCSGCKAARYSYNQLQTLQMALPIDNPPDPLDPNLKLTDEEMEARRIPIDFSDMARKYLGEETFTATCSHCNNKCTMTTTRRLATFPDFIAVCARREFYDAKLHQVRKLDAKVMMPQELDMSPFSGHGFQTGSETWMSEAISKKSSSAKPKIPSNNNNNTTTSSTSSSFQVDESQLANLVAMDFPRDQCRWALFKCKNDPELAVAYIFDHPDEPTESDLRSIDHAPATPPAPAPPTDNHNTDDNNNNNEDSAEGTVDTPRFAPKNQVGTDGVPSGYELYAMVSHMGRNAHSGHWIAHVKHPQHGWVIFNDEKVAISQKTPFTHGSIYFYRRK